MKGKLSLQDQARFLVMVHINNERVKVGLPHVRFSEDEVYLVWFSKTIQNWKALVGSSLMSGMYYEVTHNGDKNETYLDVYGQVDHVIFPAEFHTDERKEL